MSHLVRVLPPGSTVVLFDQGRALGGRTSVRRVQADGARIAAEAAAPDAYFAWDHGCQFFRADTAEFRSTILPEWLSAKLAFCLLLLLLLLILLLLLLLLVLLLLLSL